MQDALIFRLYSPVGTRTPRRKEQADPSPSKQLDGFLTRQPTESPEKSQSRLRQLYRKLESTQSKHDELFLQGEITREKRLLSALKVRDKEDPECTFRPAINSRQFLMGSFEERNEVWTQRRRHWLEDEVQGKVLRELENCSFRPRLNPSRGHTSKRLSKHEECKEQFRAQRERSRPKHKVEPGLRDYYMAKQLIHSKLISSYQ